LHPDNDGNLLPGGNQTHYMLLPHPQPQFGAPPIQMYIDAGALIGGHLNALGLALADPP